MRMNEPLFNALDTLNMRGAVTPAELDRSTGETWSILPLLLKYGMAEVIDADHLGELVVATPKGAAAYESAALV